jgi:tetratricopeptide (TPR) repeat protein
LAEKNAELLYMKGVVAERRGDLDDAIDAFRQAGAADPAQIDYVVAEVECLVTAGRPRLALQLVSRRLEEIKSDGTLELLQAEIASMLGEEQTALRALQAAYRLAGPDDNLAQEYGVLLERNGRDREAAAILYPLWDAHGPALPTPTLRSLASACIDTGQAARAKPILTAALEKDPDSRPNWSLLARAAMALDDAATVRRCADELRRIDPADPEAHLLRGYAGWKLNEPEAVRDACAIVLASDPRDVTALCLLGQVYLEGAEPELAREQFLRAIAVDPNCQWALSGLERLER